MSKPNPHLNSADIELLRTFFVTKEEFEVGKKDNALEHRKIVLELQKSIRHTEKRIIKEIASSLANTIIPTQEDHDKRLTRIEKHLSLTPIS